MNSMIEVPIVSVNDLSTLKSYAVYFGSTYKTDNTMAWTMIKSALPST
jgi:hypothetical protein